jgi:RecB family endonuclease NucS
MLRPVRGVFVAQQIKPQARVLAGQRAIDCVEVDYDTLRGVEPDELRLF